VGDKIPLVIYIASMIIFSVVIAMYKGWLLSLILFSLILVGMSFMFVFLKNLQGKIKR
jgi:c-di-AMP phosphodiesterase-like protein